MKIYLGSPYTGTPEQKHNRFLHVCKIAWDLMHRGHIVFSPIAHSHPIEAEGGETESHEFWFRQNQGWLEWCDELWIAKIPGWNASKGVKWEIETATKLGKKVDWV